MALFIRNFLKRGAWEANSTVCTIGRSANGGSKD
jgi:hypothetical protein